MTATEINQNDALAAWPIRGLARRFPAKDLVTLKTLLQEYAYRLPGDLPHGVKFVRAGGPDDDFYMATDGKGGFWFRHVEYQGFNSQRDLFGALACSGSWSMVTAMPKPSSVYGKLSVNAGWSRSKSLGSCLPST